MYYIIYFCIIFIYEIVYNLYFTITFRTFYIFKCQKINIQFSNQLFIYFYIKKYDTSKILFVSGNVKSNIFFN